MLVIAHHDISDPKGFWTKAKEVTQNLPEGLKVHSVFPSTDGKTGTCLWEADTVQQVQEFLDEHAGQFAQNACYEVNAEESMGLPAIPLRAVNLS